MQLPGYNIEHTPAVSAVSGALMYISENLSYKPRKGLQIYSSKELELMFIELLIPNKQSYVIGTVYKHPPMQHFKFNELMRNLLTEINHENKKSIIAGDFNLNLLKYIYTIRGIYEFLECFLYKNFLPQITLPT